MIRNLFIAGIITSSLLLNGCGTLYLNTPDNQLNLCQNINLLRSESKRKSGSNGGGVNRLIFLIQYAPKPLAQPSLINNKEDIYESKENQNFATGRYFYTRYF